MKSLLTLEFVLPDSLSLSLFFFLSWYQSFSAHASMAAVNQTIGEVLRSDSSAEARRGNPTNTDESLRMVISPLSQP